MFGRIHLSPAGKVPFLGSWIAAVCSRVYIRLCSVFANLQPRLAEPALSCIPARGEAEQLEPNEKPPYSKDTLPGGRPFTTVYGTIQVFEWGPERGEKVLIIHGLSTPCIALGNMAKGFVDNGYRVMMFDLFGRGYSDAPNDLSHDARLYTTQILLVLSSSPFAWTGASAFHLVGFSLGGSISVAFAAYHAHMLRSLTLLCPGGLIRTSHISRRSCFIYSSRILPEWLRLKLLYQDLEPKNGVSNAEIPDEDPEAAVDFDEVSISAGQPCIKIGDIIRWQLETNGAFVHSYLSTIRSALVYSRNNTDWKVLGAELTRRRTTTAPPGLPGGRICLILADRDAIVVKDELMEDIKQFLCMDTVDVKVLKGGHEVIIAQGKDVASIVIRSWNSQ